MDYDFSPVSIQSVTECSTKNKQFVCFDWAMFVHSNNKISTNLGIVYQLVQEKNIFQHLSR